MGLKEDEAMDGLEKTLVEVLRRRAVEEPERVAFTFLLDGERDERSLTYAGLDAEARRIAVALGSRRGHDPVVIVMEPGLDFVAAVFGCFYAGRPAVPVYPPEPRDVAGGLERVRRIAADAGSSLVLTTDAYRTWLAGEAAPLLGRLPLVWCAVDTLPEGSGADWTDPPHDDAALAFLQYTSGSTGEPRGVMVTHGNVLAHGAAVGQSLRLAPASIVVSWLPLFHDMGLVGSVLIPVQFGFRSVLMSPLAFLERPLRWLEALARYGGTLSPAPNFAYDLVVRRSTPSERRGLDLSRWMAAMNGAEPIRADVCARFLDAFAENGFRPTSLVPCYGLAEATLMVAGGPAGTVPIGRTVDGTALERHRIVAVAADAAGARTIMGCGRPAPGVEIVIVDPSTHAPCPPDEVGEIWVAGPQVGAGYWHRPAETAAAFAARLRDGRGPYLRTGDLGFLDDGMLYVTGRLKDLIVVRGRNHYPQDIERTASAAHPSLRPGGAVAFALAPDGDERLAIVQEVRAADAAGLEQAALAIGEAVRREHGLEPHAVILIAPRTLPKTSSGKVRRRACREALAAGRLVVVASWYAGVRREASRESGAPSPGAAEIEAWLVEAVARVREVTPDRIHADDPWVVLGIDSAEAAQVGADLSEWLGRSIPLRTLMQHRTLRALASALDAGAR
jgi:acyl-CoA synthetase (AMP-forming)/AMP-acid ligase II/acyl carrier protein